MRTSALALTVCACLLVVGAPAVAGPMVNHCCWDRWGVRTGADAIEANAVLGWNEYSLSWEVSGGPIGGTSTSITLPEGVGDLWIDVPAYVSWQAATHTLTFTPVGDLPDGWNWFGIERTKPMTEQAPLLTATRSISDPVFTGDLETRTVSVTLDIASGALAGKTDLSVTLAQSWDMPQGMTVAAAANVVCPSPFGWYVGSDVGFYAYDAGGLGTLSGQYTLSADITFQRSGAMSQSMLGDLLFKAPASVNYSQLVFEPNTAGTSASITLAPGVQVSFAAGQTVDFHPHAHKVAQELEFESVVAGNGAPATVHGILLAKGRRQTVTGQTVYSFQVDCNSVNVVSGTVTTPGGATFDLVPDNEEGWALDVASDVAADLDKFGDGNYAITVTGADGNQKTYVVPLSGAVPADTPAHHIACWSQTADRRPTISWDAPLDENVNLVYCGLWAYDRDYGNEFMDPSKTAMTPSEDLPYGFAMAFTAFIAGQQGTFADGAEYLSGHFTAADLGFHVVPEPGSVVLLTCGALALALRRRRTP